MKISPTLLFLLCLCSTAMSQPTAVPDSLYPSPNLAIKYHSAWTKTHYPERILEFKKNPLQVNDIVFIGNSITEQGGDWAKRFNVSTVKNRGISGDVTEGVLKRLGELIYVKPASVFILIGINDLFNPAVTAEYVANNIIEITRTIHVQSPGTKIYVQTILPTSTRFIAQKIRSVNATLLKNSESQVYTLIDLHPLFADENDLMKKEYSNDGVHLVESAYQIWTEYVKEYVAK